MGSSDKFCLKWNDFQQNVSKTFTQLRHQTELFDVTLVSSDQQQVSAHRLVLSACSDFFKNIFYKNSHAHPLLYLDGLNSEEVNLVLDYMYQGEVRIYQEHLDRFLEIAKKFNLDGLVPENDESESSEVLKDESVDVPIDDTNESSLEQYNDHTFKYSNVRERSVKVVGQNIEAQNSEINEKFEELVVKDEGGVGGRWKCTVCEKSMRDKTDMKRHLETHLSGLSYDCQYCGKIFRSVNARRQHISKHLNAGPVIH